MPTQHLDRRTLLRGLGGAAVALPALEIMSPRGRAHAQAARPPKRFVLSYGGISTGAYGKDQVVPDAVGSGYDIKRGLKPLEDLGIRNDVSVVSGLVIPWSDRTVEPPPGGRNAFFHGNTVGCQVAGTRCWRPPSSYDGTPRAPTADQIVAASPVANGTTHKVLAYRVQAASYAGSNETTGNGARLSWKIRPEGGVSPVDPVASPRAAFQALFGSVSAGASPADAQLAQLALQRRRSVLDLVRDDTQRLLLKLGQADRARLQRHLDEVRGLEARLGTTVPTGQKGCAAPPNPGGDPAVAGAIHATPAASTGYTTTAGYSEEDKRADVFTDLIAMAFACDLSRVSSFMLTFWKCYMNMFQPAGWKSDMHELTHGAGPIEAVSDSVAWHLRQWGKLVAKLKKLPEPDGTSILDHTALALVYEGGWGFDAETGRQGSPHSTENMIALLGGRAGGLKAGQHVRAPGKHPAQVVLTAMNAVGVSDGALGEVRGNLPELFR